MRATPPAHRHPTPVGRKRRPDRGRPLGTPRRGPGLPGGRDRPLAGDPPAPVQMGRGAPGRYPGRAGRLLCPPVRPHPQAVALHPRPGRPHRAGARGHPRPVGGGRRPPRPRSLRPAQLPRRNLPGPQRELRGYGEYRTRRLVLEAWERLFGCRSVVTYCGAWNNHDQYFFRHRAEMVTGAVRAPGWSWPTRPSCGLTSRPSGWPRSACPWEAPSKMWSIPGSSLNCPSGRPPGCS